MKAHQVAAVVRDLPAMYGRETAVLTAQNGIPWWYFMRVSGPHENRRLESVDPGGIIADNLPAERVIGSVVYPAAEITEPGVIKHIEGNRFSIAEINNEKTERVTRISECIAKSRIQGARGLRYPRRDLDEALGQLELQSDQRPDPRDARRHLQISNRPATPRRVMMREAQAVGEALGIRFRIPLEKRIAGAEAVGPHKTSMLQDIEAGRGIEADALIGSVIELGQRRERCHAADRDDVCLREIACGDICRARADD